MEIITRILASMPEFVSSYGGRAVTGLTEANFHIIDSRRLSEDGQEAILGAGVAGLYDFDRQRLLVLPDERSQLTTAQRMVHETLHLESFLSFTADDISVTGQSNKVLLRPRRIGLSVFNDAYTKRFFRGIDEAVIEELTARFDARYFSLIPSLATEIERREEMRKTTQILNRNQIASVVDTVLPDRRYEITIHAWRYGSERKMLDSLMTNLYEANTNRFTSREEVFDIVAQAVLTGKLLNLARLIERTLGEGSMRALGENTMLLNTEGDTSSANL